MGISGNIKTMALAELLQWLSMGQKTGTLVIDNKKVEKRIVFAEGLIIASASTDPKEYLGRFLAGNGFIAEETVNQAVAQQKVEKQLLGKILVGMGAIEEEDLHQMLRLKSEESIYDIFTWEEGDFEFLDGDLPEETMIRMSLDVQWIVLEGSRRMDEWNRIREWVPSTICVPVSIVDFQELELEEVDQRILEWIDDDRSVEEISQESETSLFQVANILADQVQQGTVKVVRPRTIEIEVPATEGEKDPAKLTQPVPLPQSMPLPPQMAQMAQYAHPMQMPAYAAQPPPVQTYAPPPADPGMQVGGRTLHFAGAPQPGMPPAAYQTGEVPIMPQPGVPPAAYQTGEVPIMPQPGAPQPGAQQQAQPASAAEGHVQEAEILLQQGDFEQALAAFRKAKTAQGADSSIESAVTRGEQKITDALDRDGIRLSTVPRLKCGMEELTKLDISPQEGFLLTRIDGSYDIKSILKLSPMPLIDAQLLFWRLKKLGHIAV